MIDKSAIDLSALVRKWRRQAVDPRNAGDAENVYDECAAELDAVLDAGGDVMSPQHPLEQRLPAKPYGRRIGQEPPQEVVAPRPGPRYQLLEEEQVKDLYELDLTGADWVKLCGGNTGDQSDDDSESCVELAPIPGVTDAYAVRDSKNHSAGTLRFTSAELAAFVEKVNLGA
jgi:hypothetical protein